MSVELIDHLGDDLTIVNAARVSFHKRAACIGAAERGLLDAMLRDRHGSPFEHVVFSFRVRTAIGVAREWFRHRIGSFNEESTRYVAMRPDFAVPAPDQVRRQVGKALAYRFEPLDRDDAASAVDLFERSYRAAYTAYRELLALGVAKELARNVLPLGLLTEFVWTVNLRSLFNFLSLRTHPSALREIRDEAEVVEALVCALVPETMALWNQHGRQAL